MSFTSFPAVIYVALVCLFSFVFSRMKKEMWRKIFLLISSYVFIALVDWRFCINILATTVVIYLFAQSKRRKPLLIIVVSALLTQLAFFKYLGFFANSIGKVLGQDYVTINIVIPLGISFYTFSAISFIVDTYKGTLNPKQSFFDVALFLAFFPKLMAGPIVRGKVFFQELGKKTLSNRDLSLGLQMFVGGVFKKMVLADNLGVFVNDVFYCPSAFNGITCFWAILSYSFQIYFDFSGYSDMAIGISKMLGFNFPKNFNLPYASKSVTEFWKRWHISLSTWLMEYLYFSLGGNRKGSLRTYINLLLTMLIGGLWHGAAWTFVIWGGLHGIALIIHKIFMNWKVRVFNDKFAGNVPWKIFSTISTFVTVSFIWVFFRADSFSCSLEMFSSLRNFSGISQIYTWTFVAIFFALLEISIAYRSFEKNNKELNVPYLSLNLRKFTHLVLFWCILGLIAMTAYLGDTSFIYGRF